MILGRYKLSVVLQQFYVFDSVTNKYNKNDEKNFGFFYNKVIEKAKACEQDILLRGK